ncbi:hydrogenase formation protein HypD, partial [Parabacteroides distasonis]|uniref:hydrogenase formation protein HypD n=2 Tax=Parabacteroides TaxID=375288 RepID=UPI0034A2A994
MRFVDEYRSNEKVQTLLEAIRKKVTRPWYIMEICGGQTHAIARYRLEEMLPPDLQLLHGPGCPVCVTPVETIDYALKLATQPNVILASFGDMMRVPGSKEDLLSVKARGADIRMLYTPLDALSLAKENPDKEIVFFAIGFETTAPVHLMALKEAIRRGLPNFSILTSL